MPKYRALPAAHGHMDKRARPVTLAASPEHAAGFPRPSVGDPFWSDPETPKVFCAGDVIEADGQSYTRNLDRFEKLD